MKFGFATTLLTAVFMIAGTFSLASASELKLGSEKKKVTLDDTVALANIDDLNRANVTVTMSKEQAEVVEGHLVRVFGGGMGLIELGEEMDIALQVEGGVMFGNIGGGVLAKNSTSSASSEGFFLQTSFARTSDGQLLLRISRSETTRDENKEELTDWGIALLIQSGDMSQRSAKFQAGVGLNVLNIDKSQDEYVVGDSFANLTLSVGGVYY